MNGINYLRFLASLGMTGAKHEETNKERFFKIFKKIFLRF